MTFHPNSLKRASTFLGFFRFPFSAPRKPKKCTETDQSCLQFRLVVAIAAEFGGATGTSLSTGCPWDPTTLLDLPHKPRVRPRLLRL
jgi:hypothetical protein